MTFKPCLDKFCGILKSYSDTGYPVIELNASKPNIEAYNTSNVLDYNNIYTHYASLEADGLNAYFIVHLVKKAFLVTHYALRSHYSSDYCLRGWKLEGSIDNINYEILDLRNTSDLENSGTVQYEINTARRIYSYFRIMSTKNTTKDQKLRISALDFYGTFNYIKTNPKCINNYFHVSSLLTVFIYYNYS